MALSAYLSFSGIIVVQERAGDISMRLEEMLTPIDRMLVETDYAVPRAGSAALGAKAYEDRRWVTDVGAALATFGARPRRGDLRGAAADEHQRNTARPTPGTT